ncbi:DeoR/GlpR family DNA-binding transcription regulator [Bacillus swezeyi]|uniref:DeoR/GlpR family DNA-binding transcription regulator n=1 Tax=Bacillus swezeyi TaxID=1925020 RepID=UPI0027DCB1EF|nr:DeoR/GlpR family DNA-binding transcription regulator [Bacillus swezeyi]
MLIAERQQRIVELVNERESVRVSELSKIFSVTEETIRRDLEKLEKNKQLARSHGGAVSLQPSDSSEIPYTKREIINVKEKKQIALEAVKHVKAGDKIILDASTTAWYMAKALPDEPLTVLTNSIKVALELSDKKEITVISTGGTLLSKSLSYVGPLAEASLKTYFVDKAFISCKGLHIERGMSESDEHQAIIKRTMVNSAERTYVLVDYSKFGVQDFSRIDQLDIIHRVITDHYASPSVLQQLEEKGVEVTVVDTVSQQEVI